MVTVFRKIIVSILLVTSLKRIISTVYSKRESYLAKRRGRFMSAIYANKWKQKSKKFGESFKMKTSNMMRKSSSFASIATLELLKTRCKSIIAKYLKYSSEVYDIMKLFNTYF